MHGPKTVEYIDGSYLCGIHRANSLPEISRSVFDQPLTSDPLLKCFKDLRTMAIISGRGVFLVSMVWEPIKGSALPISVSTQVYLLPTLTLPLIDQWKGWEN